MSFFGASEKSSKEYETERQDLVHLSRDNFSRRLRLFSRNNFDNKQRLLLHAHLMELLQSRLSNVTDKIIHDYIRLAYIAEFYDLSLTIFHARHRLDLHQGQISDDAMARKTPSDANASSNLLTSLQNVNDVGVSDASLPSQGTKNSFVVSEYIVDSAYALQHHAELVRLASCCSCYLRECATIPGVIPETMAYLSLLRCFWRAVCLSEEFSREEADNGSGGNSKQTLDDARYIMKHYVTPLFPMNNTMTHSSRSTILDSFMRSVVRVVKYDSSGDSGEMLFFKRCLELGFFNTILTNHQSFQRKSRKDTVESKNGGPETQVGVLTHDEYEHDDGGILHTEVDLSILTMPSTSHSTSDVDFLCAHLINTCAAGKHTATAMTYLDYARKSIGLPPILIGSLDGTRGGFLVGETTSKKTSDVNGAGLFSIPHPLKSIQGDASTATQVSVSEYVLYRLLHVLHITRDNSHIIDLARTMLRECGASSIGISVWSIILVSAGEVRATDVALEAYHIARSLLQDSGEVTMSPTEQQKYEYLLQTSLNTLSKCQMKNFEQQYLIPCQEAGLLNCTEEFYFCCLLQDAHNSLDPVGQCRAIRNRMNDRDVALTVGIVSRLLKIYLRMESVEFFQTYRHAVQDLKLSKPAWVDSLLLWADRRRYFLKQEERGYIISEVRRVKANIKGNSTDTDLNNNINNASFRGLLGGLRTQYALIEYDYNQQPLKYFLKHREAPPVEPTLLDSRMHFLLKKPYCVAQGLAGTPNGVDGKSPLSVIADPVRRIEISWRASLLGPLPLLLKITSGGDDDNEQHHQRFSVSLGSHPDSSTTTATNDREVECQEEAFRVYLSYMLEGLQRSRNFV
ncbi:unnamed protein product [Phytomonas sp. Hart1]|nr:unnamed protein product [Phytomonas sp. Hart1]|eukprot:CCW67589.1 unnamed protein product [Phytomonas sp. isolate Hart1]